MLQCWITGADLSPDKKTLALLSHDKLWLYSCFEGDKFFGGKVVQLNMNHFSHKAGIAFVNNHEIYIVDGFEMNILGGKLYRIDISEWVQNDCN